MCRFVVWQDAVESRRMVGVVLQYLNARGLWQGRGSFCVAILRLLQQVLAPPYPRPCLAPHHGPGGSEKGRCMRCPPSCALFCGEGCMYHCHRFGSRQTMADRGSPGRPGVCCRGAGVSAVCRTAASSSDQPRQHERTAGGPAARAQPPGRAHAHGTCHPCAHPLPAGVASLTSCCSA